MIKTTYFDEDYRTVDESDAKFILQSIFDDPFSFEIWKILSTYVSSSFSWETSTFILFSWTILQSLHL